MARSSFSSHWCPFLTCEVPPKTPSGQAFIHILELGLIRQKQLPFLSVPLFLLVAQILLANSGRPVLLFPSELCLCEALYVFCSLTGVSSCSPRLLLCCSMHVLKGVSFAYAVCCSSLQDLFCMFHFAFFGRCHCLLRTVSSPCVCSLVSI